MVYSLCQTTSVEANRMEVGGLHGLLPTTSQKSHNIVTDSKQLRNKNGKSYFAILPTPNPAYIADVKKNL